MIVDRLIESIEKKENPTVLGLDTCLEYLPTSFTEQFNVKSLMGASSAILAFNKAMIDALKDIVPCVKIQSAYYEMYGIPGIAIMDETIRYARDNGLITILDVKRNDIGDTSKAYADTYLGETSVGNKKVRTFSGDFVTINPYLGIDSIDPFVKTCAEYDCGIFVLIKTSNPSACQLQDLILEDGRKVYEAAADLVHECGKDFLGEYGYSRVGAVVGTAYPEQGASLRKRLPNTFFLVPRYGTQGVTSKNLSTIFDKKKRGAVVNASRSLLCAWKKWGTEDFITAAREEALKMKEDIQDALL